MVVSICRRFYMRVGTGRFNRSSYFASGLEKGLAYRLSVRMRLSDGRLRSAVKHHGGDRVRGWVG